MQEIFKMVIRVMDKLDTLDVLCTETIENREGDLDLDVVVLRGLVHIIKDCAKDLDQATDRILMEEERIIRILEARFPEIEETVKAIKEGISAEEAYGRFYGVTKPRTEAPCAAKGSVQ